MGTNDEEKFESIVYLSWVTPTFTWRRIFVLSRIPSLYK